MGGCACGSVRYSIDSKPLFSYFCQCRDCQRATGSGHAALMMFAATGISLSGSTSVFEKLLENGHRITREFCPSCGSPVAVHIDAYPDRGFIYATSLDDPEAFRPSKVLWNVSACAWDTVQEGLEVCERGP